MIMTDKRRNTVTKIVETMSKLSEKNQAFVLGFANGLQISDEQEAKKWMTAKQGTS